MIKIRKKHMIGTIVIMLIIVGAVYLWFAIIPTLWEFSLPTGKWDWLGFVGSILSFLGTMILGIISIWLNYKNGELVRENDERNRKVENEKLRLLNLPFFSINTHEIYSILATDTESNFYTDQNDTTIKLIDNKYNVFIIETDLINKKISIPQMSPDMNRGVIPENTLHIGSLINSGNNTAQNVQFEIILQDDDILYEYPYIRPIYKSEERHLHFDFSNTLHASKKPQSFTNSIEIEVSYADIFQNKYRQTFNISIQYDIEEINNKLQGESRLGFGIDSKSSDQVIIERGNTAFQE